MARPVICNKRRTSGAAPPRPAHQRFGAHMSVAGGVHNAFYTARDAGCDCVQLFVKNQRQWHAPPVTAEHVDLVRAAREQTGMHPALAHASYLLNLASPAAAARRRSINALIDELRRCARFAVPFLVLHPGAHMGDGIDTGIGRIVKSLNATRKRFAGPVTLLLEVTAGQGSAIGWQLEHLADILRGVDDDAWLDICLDTCHLFAAGYNIRTAAGYADFADRLDRLIGLKRVMCIHVNDSKRELGSRVDRHDHIGRGRIGIKGFAHLLNDPRLASAPRILETPKGKDGRGADLDRVNLRRLRKLVST